VEVTECRDLRDAALFQLVRDRRLTLLLRQLVDCRLEFIEKHVAGVNHLRSGIERRQQLRSAVLRG
jgi:hypothetical protein